ncbi:MAG TPA: alanine dehydrogenase [Actinomycetota bacterium]|nr:alanine dehydrogenase [Actinomycetota bacterium]
MIVGVPTEVKDHEYRVALTPAGARELVHAGHRVLIQAGAGSGSVIPDSQYQAAGAEIVGLEAVWQDAELILKVKEPIPIEFERLSAGPVPGGSGPRMLFTYLHLAASLEVTQALTSSRMAAIGYETVQTADGRLPLLAPMSEVAGRMAPHVGANLLEKGHGGRGILMGGVSGVQPAKVVVLGAGMAGANAAWIAQGMEAEVIILDRSLDRLRYVDSIHKGRILTLMSNRTTIEESVLAADLAIGAVLVPGALAPHLVSKEIVAAMRPGSVVVDIAIDQGGCFETSHMTTHSHPTYVAEGVVHYCVGNMPGAVPNTSTYALTNATLPYVLALAGHGLRAAAGDPVLAAGVNCYGGQVVNRPVAEALGLPYVPLEKALPRG